MLRIIDYVFYRWYLLYSRHDESPSMYASVIVSAYIVLTVINVYAFSKIAMMGKVPSPDYIIPLSVFVMIFSFFRYERNFEMKPLKEKLEQESPRTRKRKWLLIVAYLILFGIAPWMYGFATA